MKRKCNELYNIHQALEIFYLARIKRTDGAVTVSKKQQSLVKALIVLRKQVQNGIDMNDDLSTEDDDIEFLLPT